MAFISRKETVEVGPLAGPRILAKACISELEKFSQPFGAGFRQAKRPSLLAFLRTLAEVPKELAKEKGALLEATHPN